jgi:hypothetical protein
MSDIFISYAREDRERAKALAEALTARGWSIWWDHNIRAGEEFDEVIAENLAAAKCVIVLWSSVSARSRWVKTEAGEGARREVLLPVALEADVEIPLEFKRLQTVYLNDWKPNVAHREFDRFVEDISTIVPLRDSPATSRPIANKPPDVRDAHVNQIDSRRGLCEDGTRSPPGKIAPRSGLQNRWLALTLLMLPAAIVATLTLALMNWTIPTQIKLDLVVNRLTFTLAGRAPVSMLEGALSSKSITFENFKRVVFSPKTLSLAGLDLGGKSGVELTGITDSKPSITIEPAEQTERPSLSLADFSAKPGSRITIETTARDATSVSIEVDGEPPVGAVLTRAKVRIEGRDVQFGSQRPVARFESPIYVTPRVDDPTIKIEPTRSIVVIVVPVATGPVQFLGKPGAPISKIEFEQERDGHPVTSMIAPAELSYADTGEKLSIGNTAFISLDAPTSAAITALTLDRERRGLHVVVEGEFGKIKSASATLTRDYRLTQFDRLWRNYKLAMVLSIVGAVFSATLAVLTYFQNSKGRQL